MEPPRGAAGFGATERPRVGTPSRAPAAGGAVGGSVRARGPGALPLRWVRVWAPALRHGALGHRGEVGASRSPFQHCLMLALCLESTLHGPGVGPSVGVCGVLAGARSPPVTAHWLWVWAAGAEGRKLARKCSLSKTPNHLHHGATAMQNCWGDERFRGIMGLPIMLGRLLERHVNPCGRSKVSFQQTGIRKDFLCKQANSTAIHRKFKDLLFFSSPCLHFFADASYNTGWSSH